MKDDDRRRNDDVVPLFAPAERGDLFDRVGGIEHRLGSIETLLAEIAKDIKTALGIKDARVADLDERANQLERDIVDHRQQLGLLNQLATKRLKAARKK